MQKKRLRTLKSMYDKNFQNLVVGGKVFNLIKAIYGNLQLHYKF